MKRNKVIASVVALAALSLGAVACGSDADSSADAESASLIVSDARSREPAEGQTRGVVYVSVANPTDNDITIVSATSPTSDQVELHDTTMADDGAMSMAEAPEGFTVPAGGEFVFEPGGPHIMLLDIDAATYPETVDVTLSFDNDITIEFVAEVREIGDGAVDMDEMEDGEMEDGEMEDGEMETDEG
jgi:copper(I)-binding protein